MESLSWPYNLWDGVLDSPHVPYQEPRYEDDQEPVLYIQNLDAVISSAMKERYQKALRLRYEQGMTYRKIGENIGTNSEGTRQIIVNALRILRKPENFYRLSAVPEIEVVKQRRENKELAQQNEELKKKITELLAQIECENAEKRLGISLDAPVAELKITVRSENRLIANGIDTVGKLVNCSEEHIRGIRNLGKASFNDIVKALARYGYTLK